MVLKEITTGAKKRLFVWGMSAEGRLNIGNPSQFIFLEGYGKMRLGIFEFKGGRVKETIGLCDTVTGLTARKKMMTWLVLRCGL